MFPVVSTGSNEFQAIHYGGRGQQYYHNIIIQQAGPAAAAADAETINRVVKCVLVCWLFYCLDADYPNGIVAAC